MENEGISTRRLSPVCSALVSRPGVWTCSEAGPCQGQGLRGCGVSLPNGDCTWLFRETSYLRILSPISIASGRQKLRFHSKTGSDQGFWTLPLVLFEESSAIFVPVCGPRSFSFLKLPHQAVASEALGAGLRLPETRPSPQGTLGELRGGGLSPRYGNHIDHC